MQEPHTVLVPVVVVLIPMVVFRVSAGLCVLRTTVVQLSPKIVQWFDWFNPSGSW